MMHRSFILRVVAVFALVAGLCCTARGQGVKRLIVIKVDGLPNYYVDQVVKQRDPETGRSVLPWFEEIFYKNGTRIPNFYSRGMSLSGPAWGQLDTGQHLQIKGNVEYDRYTLHSYDYLAFIPYYTDFFLGHKADMPAVEVLDQLKMPLFQDVFPFERRYTSNQLYQRGITVETLAGGFIRVFPQNARDFIDEWTLGFDFRNATVEQNERDIVGMVSTRPEIDYYDYYDGVFDHVSHHNNDTPSRVAVLKELDRTIGRIWTAIQASTRAEETAMVLISDHGFNSEAGVYSQGFNLVRLLASRAGGGHHVVTKRRLMLDYSIKGLDPFTPLIKNPSKESSYLDRQSDKYPTALLDFDGNERASIHLRENRLNILHILLQQLKRKELSPAVRKAATEAFFDTIDEKRSEWQRTADELAEELDALGRWNVQQEAVIKTLPKRHTPDEKKRGLDKQTRRIRTLADIGVQTERKYRKYLSTLRNLLTLRRDGVDARKIEIESVIAPDAMGDANSVYDLQNYVVGLSQSGLTIHDDGKLDGDRSFARVNYFDLLLSQRVRNNVQAKVSNQPVDLVAVRIPRESLPKAFRAERDAIWLYGDPRRQALILSRREADGGTSYSYRKISGLVGAPDGTITFDEADPGPGYPLKITADATWLSGWHTEVEWLRAMHRGEYSNAIIGLNEQLLRHDLPDAEEVAAFSRDEQLIRRFRLRQRHRTEADMLILANNHWNFDVRGFNPGGNHGSFFRASTNATFMLAGGDKTGIPKGLAIDEPYDSLSVVPTLFSLMGRVDANNKPDADLYQLGFRRFPGRVVKELFSR